MKYPKHCTNTMLWKFRKKYYYLAMTKQEESGEKVTI